MSVTTLDHITITAPTLEAGAELVYKSLGVMPQKGGEHPRMGTHNLFLRLGDALFLEVIAVNPKAEKPSRPRWFALDKIKTDTLAELKTWVIRTNNIHKTLNQCSESLGEIEPMSRGDNNWLITIPKDGKLPLNNGAPALIEWQVEAHPALSLDDHGLSLEKLQISHPDPKRLSKLLQSMNLSKTINNYIEITKGSSTKIVAYINTPKGLRKLHR